MGKWSGEERRKETLDVMGIARTVARETANEIFFGFGYDISDPKEKKRLREHMGYLGSLYMVCVTMKSTALKVLVTIIVGIGISAIGYGTIILINKSNLEIKGVVNDDKEVKTYIR